MIDSTLQEQERQGQQHSLFRRGLSRFELVLGGLLIFIGTLVWTVGEEKVISFILSVLFPDLANDDLGTNPLQFFFDLIRFIEFSFGQWFISFPVLMFIVFAVDIVGLMTGISLLVAGLVLQMKGGWPWIGQLLIPFNILLALIIWTSEFSSSPP